MSQVSTVASGAMQVEEQSPEIFRAMRKNFEVSPPPHPAGQGAHASTCCLIPQPRTPQPPPHAPGCASHPNNNKRRASPPPSASDIRPADQQILAARSRTTS